MARLSRKLRVCKWVGTAGCALVALALAGSWWWQLGFSWYSKSSCYGCTIGSGSLWLMRVPASMIPGNAGWDLRAAEGTPPGSGRPAIVPSVLAFEEADGYFMFVPLWMPFLILLVPTLLLWWREGKPRQGHCRRCGYDLTGNVSGRCPECGAVVPAGPPVNSPRPQSGP